MWVITYKYGQGFRCYGCKLGVMGEQYPTKKLAMEKLKTCHNRRSWQVTKVPESEEKRR